MRLRWLVKRREWTEWSDYLDAYIPASMQFAQQLQYFDEANNRWHDVPTVVEVEK